MIGCLAITNQPDTPPFFKSLNTSFSYNSSHGVADVRVGIADKGGRYEVTAFVNNAFDENYNSNLFDARQLYGGSFVMWGVKTRNSRRYYGLNAKFNF